MSVVMQRNIDAYNFLASEPVASARIGQTPHAIVARAGAVTLRYFAPEKALTRPVVISMPLINTWAIWDLTPETSLIGDLLRRGIPVYVIDWGRPGRESEELPLSHFIDTVLGRMFDRALRHARTVDTTVEKLDAIGYCVGGTFLTVYVARNPGVVRKLALVAAPIDFHASGRLSTWAHPDNFPVDHAIDGLGNYPSEMMKSSFAWLRPMGQARKWFAVWERAGDPAFRKLWASMERWSNDAVDFPGEAYREYVKRCYFDNAMMKGGWILGGTPVDLTKGTCPLLAIAAKDDHIAAPASVIGISKVWGGPVETVTMKGGHVGISVTSALPETLAKFFLGSAPQ